jgi:hypothetical protein
METDGLWEVMDYGGAEDVGCEGRLEKGVVHEPHIHGLDANVDPIGKETAVCNREKGQIVIAGPKAALVAGLVQRIVGGNAPEKGGS